MNDTSRFDLAPQTATAAFNAHNALLLARAAEVVYRSPAEVENVVVRQWQFRHFEFLDIDDTQAFVASNREHTMVVFRGTEPGSFADWFTDLETELVPGPLDGKVHAGFYDALSEVWQLISHLVERFDGGRGKSIWVTGHSLGAALATLAVARWIDAGRPISGLYTFGQPRTGDAVFARNFNFEFRAQAFRVVNNNDLVTRIPPRAFGYRHLGSFQYFTADGGFSEQITWWRTFLDRWRGQLATVLALGLDGISDHSMINYRQCIERLAVVRRTQSTEFASPRLRVFDPTKTFAQKIRPRRRAA